YRAFDAEDQRDRGDYLGAIAAATAIADEAKALWPMVHAEALYLLGTAQSFGGDTVKGAATLREAAALAERAHHDYIAANVWLALAQGAAFDAGDPARGLEYVSYAEAAVARIDRKPDMVTMLEYTRGAVLIEADRAAEGEASLVRALDLAQRSAPELIAIVTQGLGYLHEDRGRYDEAVAAYRRALAHLPPGPATGTEVTFRNRLAINLSLLGHTEEAEREARAALAIAERILGETHLDRAVAHLNLAQVLDDAGKFEAALAEAELGARAVARILGERSERYGEALALEANVLADLGRFEEAERRFARACDIIAYDTGEASSQQAECWLHEASALGGLGRHAQALAQTEKALAALTKAYGPSHPHVANAYVTRGELHAELGHRDRALVDLEKARALFSEIAIDPGHLAAAEWGLGRLVFATDPARGKALVAQAVARFGKANPSWKQSADDAKAWLATAR
ncbi:MAG: tetratricopeptide repeat protein, partial [Deltaproteobacteria bacterium]|nr:tetratricopeptide repeat protein [Deltaproteobacteria bacterium]